MADLAAGIRALLNDYANDAVGVGPEGTLIATLRAVVDRCDDLSQSDLRIRAGIGLSILRDIARELDVTAEHEVPVFAPRPLGEVHDA
jgi:hypothetical protein